VSIRLKKHNLSSSIPIEGRNPDSGDKGAIVALFPISWTIINLSQGLLEVLPKAVISGNAAGL
jgi:hypothetical protein